MEHSASFRSCRNCQTLMRVMCNSSSFNQSDIITHSSDSHYWHIYAVKGQLSIGEEFWEYGIRNFCESRYCHPSALKFIQIQYAGTLDWNHDTLIEVWWGSEFCACFWCSRSANFRLRIQSRWFYGDGNGNLEWWCQLTHQESQMFLTPISAKYSNRGLTFSHFSETRWLAFRNWREQILSIPCGSALITLDFYFQASLVSKTIKT